MPQAPRTWIRAGDRRQPGSSACPHPGSRPCRGTPRQNRPPLRSSKRLPGTSISLPGITLSDEGGQGERARTRRSYLSRWRLRSDRHLRQADQVALCTESTRSAEMRASQMYISMRQLA
jgi:hypothetical protein